MGHMGGLMNCACCVALPIKSPIFSLNLFLHVDQPFTVAAARFSRHEPSTITTNSSTSGRSEAVELHYW